MTADDNKPWHDGLPKDDTSAYEDQVNRIRNAVAKGIPFEQAAGLAEAPTNEMKAAIVDDALKVLIAEQHFTGGKSTAEVARKLKIDVKLVDKARKEMLKAVEAEAIAAYRVSAGQQGNA
jgi:hypothetical protein